MVFAHMSSHRLPTAHPAHIGSGAGFLLISFIHDQRLARIVQQLNALACFQAVAGGTEKIYLRPSDQFCFFCGAMASSAVSSVLYQNDIAGNYAETCTGAYIFFGDAASFHEWEFRTRLRTASRTGDQYMEAMSKVCDGLRSDAICCTTGSWP